MKDLLIVLFFSFCCLTVSAQDNLGLAWQTQIVSSPASTAEYIGYTLMSGGGCILAVQINDRGMNGTEKASFFLTGAALIVTGFLTYMIGAVHLSDEPIFKKKDATPFIQ